MAGSGKSQKAPEVSSGDFNTEVFSVDNTEEKLARLRKELDRKVDSGEGLVALKKRVSEDIDKRLADLKEKISRDYDWEDLTNLYGEMVGEPGEEVDERKLLEFLERANTINQ